MDARRLVSLAASLSLAATSVSAGAHDSHHHHAVAPAAPPTPGPAANAAALRSATDLAARERFQGGAQVFPYAPGHVYEVWTAPLRVTGLTLGLGETVTAMAAGDTVQWQIGQTTSGEGAALRTHVLIKPIRSGLATNLVLTTNRRLYVIALRSGSSEAFNPLVSWTPEATPPPVVAPSAPTPPPLPAEPLRELDARYSIVPKGRRPAWTPTAVMTDGRRTFFVFPAKLATDEAPALFAVGPDGARQMVNYRQKDGVFIADRVLGQAELKLGDRHPQLVSISREAGGAP